MREEELLAQHMGLVRMAVLRCGDTQHDREDLTQIGTVGLLKAIRRFDPAMGVQFSTYAVPLIFGEIRRFLRDDSMIHVSRSVKELHKKIRRAEADLQLNLGRSPTLGELAEATGLCRESLLEAMDAPLQTDSLDEPLEEDGTPRGNLIAAPDGSEVLLVQDSLRHLAAEERRLISLRYFLGKTQQETGEVLQMSQVQVSRKEKKILEKLRHLLE